MQSSDKSRFKQTAVWQTGRRVKSTVQRAVFAAAARRILNRRFRLVVIAGQKRSGNHAFINWFLSQSRGPCVFFNHVAPDQYPTERHRREFRLNGVRALPTVAFSYEDRDLEDIFSGALQDFIARHEEQIERRDLCLILRDPRNLMASRFKKWPEEHRSEARADTVMARWTAYAETALTRPTDLGFPLMSVYYNVFITERSYRDAVAKNLGILQGDRGLDTVSNYGHGSSFDGLSAGRDPATMDIFDRWRAFEDDVRFRRLFENDQIAGLARALEAEVARR